MSYEPIARGKVASLCINGEATDEITFTLFGPRGDKHVGMQRALSGHDHDYLRTSSLQKGATVLNMRSWTGLSQEEIQAVGRQLGVTIPQGCLLENITFTGIPDFSQLPPMSRFVFPKCDLIEDGFDGQAILLVTEQNGPCKTVGKRLEEAHRIDGLMQRFVSAAKGRRGVMGMVYSQGIVRLGQEVLVYPPVGSEMVVPA